MLHVHCPCCMSMFMLHVHVRAACPCPSACLCQCCICMSIVHIHAARPYPWTFCMSMSMLHFCPCCMSVKMLHVRIHASCLRPCFFSLYVFGEPAVHFLLFSPLSPLAHSQMPSQVATHQEIGSQLLGGETPDSNPGLQDNSLARDTYIHTYIHN